MKPLFNALAFLLLASIASTAPVAAARASNQQASQAALRGSNNEAARHMKEKNDKQQTTGGGDTEIESRLANCAVRGNTATIEPKAISGTGWQSLVSGGNLCESDCDCASGCCGWFWVNICVEPSMQGMKCRGTGTTNQQPEDEVPGTGSGGDDNQETLAIATPAGNIDDVPSVTPPLETPVEPKETGISAEVPLEDTPDSDIPGTPAEIFYPVEYPEGHPNAIESKETAIEVPLEDTPDSDIPGTPAESFYPVEYPEGHPNAIESKETATESKETATESKETKEGRDAGPGAKSKKSKGTNPGRNNDADATKKGGPKKMDGGTQQSEETKEGRDADLGATTKKGGPKKMDGGAQQSEETKKGRDAEPGATEDKAKGAKQSDAKTGAGGTETNKVEKDQDSVAAGESRIGNCAVRGNTLTIQPKAVNDWSSLVMGGNLCESDCDCASGCCGWFWVNMCVDPSMQGMKCMGDSQQVSRTEGDDDEDTDLELPAPEETNLTETVIEIITPKEEEGEEKDVEAKEDIDDEEGAVTEPKKSFNNKGDAADKSRSKTGAKALSNRKKKKQQQQQQQEEEEEEEEEKEEALDLENKTEDGAGEELLDNYDFSNGWPEWNADMCQQSSQCKSNCCAWAHSFVCMSKTTSMGRFTCIE